MGFFDDLKKAISGEVPVLGYFIISADNEELGPYSKEDIVGFLGEGLIGWSTMIRRGDDDWREIQHHPDFPSAPGPPPMPEKRAKSSKSAKHAKPRKRKQKKKKEYQAPAANGTIVIEYLNYAGELKQFICDPKSIVRKGNHFSVRVAPTFKRISLDRSKTRILKGVPAPAVMPAEPLPVRTTTADTSIIQYTNWEGINKEFKIITGVVDDKGDYVRVRVSPTFKYITLKHTRIGNPEALFEATPAASMAESETKPAETPVPDSTVSIILTNCGLATYDANQVLREIRPDLGVFDLYNLVRNFPQTIVENISREQAEAFKKRLEDAGCTVELK